MCLYGCAGGTYEQRYHIIPESISNYELIAKEGLVCDACNEYFGLKLENEFIETHPGRTLLAMRIGRTKKGKHPKREMSNGWLTMEPGEGTSRNISMPMTSSYMETLDNGDLRMTTTYAAKKGWSPKIISRLLYKMSLETVAQNGQITFHDDDLQRLTSYIRQGKGLARDFPFAYKESDIREKGPHIEAHKEGESCGVVVNISLPGVLFCVPLHMHKMSVAPKPDFTLVAAKNERVRCLDCGEATLNFPRLEA